MQGRSWTPRWIYVGRGEERWHSMLLPMSLGAPLFDAEVEAISESRGGPHGDRAGEVVMEPDGDGTVLSISDWERGAAWYRLRARRWPSSRGRAWKHSRVPIHGQPMEGTAWSELPSVSNATVSSLAELSPEWRRDAARLGPVLRLRADREQVLTLWVSALDEAPRAWSLSLEPLEGGEELRISQEVAELVVSADGSQTARVQVDLSGRLPRSGEYRLGVRQEPATAGCVRLWRVELAD